MTGLKSISPSSEGQMLVAPGNGVVEVDVGKPRLPLDKLFGNRYLSLALEMPHVEGETQRFRGKPFEKIGEPQLGIDEHPRFRLEGNRDPLPCPVLDGLFEPFDQSGVDRIVIRRFVQGAGPDRNAIAAESSGTVDAVVYRTAHGGGGRRDWPKREWARASCVRRADSVSRSR